ncbi:MAG: HPr(Ser) kinase/phosphatase [Candidatus Kapabacteria bacterium]|nr:HPr(Ser) kinase/phosphatase [Candidatus Kapabacteria bacterium]
MDIFKNLNVLQQDFIPVEILYKSPAKLEKLNGDIGNDNRITNKNLSRPQLALAGFVEFFTNNRVQIFGNTEFYYLKSLSNEDRIKSFRNISQFEVPCIVLTGNKVLEPELMEIANERNIAVFSSPFDSTKLVFGLSEFLDDQFAPQVVVHGSLVDVYGVGMMFHGQSGIGKSEVALDLVERGHRLVADDIVMLTKKRESILMGTGTNTAQHFMEIRGLGIINVREMFGIRSTRFQKRLEIIVHLEQYQPDHEYTRLGLEDEPANILGIDIQFLKLPIFPGKNITVITEVIALNYLLRTYGYNAPKVFAEMLTNSIAKKSGPQQAFHDRRMITYFQGDNE